MAAVVNALEINRIFDNGQGAKEGAHDKYGALMDAAQKRDIPVLRPPVICGTHHMGEARVTVLHPCHDEAGYDPTLSFNDNSLVLLITYRHVAVLLTGDIGFEAEELLLRSGRIPPIDILKVPHHGSRTSSSGQLLDATSPAVGVVSAGPWNRFRLPHKDVLRRLRTVSVSPWRTDQLGAIRITTNGRVIEVGSVEPRRSPQ
jgi:competence protein ComEC